MRKWIGLVLVSLFFVVGITAPWIAPHYPDEDRLLRAFEGSSLSHPFGLDQNGRDLLSSIILGAQNSLVVGLGAVLISALFGLLLGVISGLSRGWVDKLCLLTMDIVLAFPGILLAIALAFALGPGLWNVIIAISATGWVAYARLVRAEVLQLRETDFVMSAHAIGAGRLRLVLRYLIPNIASLLVIQMTFGIAAAIIIEGTLSFLGIGTPLDQASWGAMLNQGREYIISHPQLTLLPGLALMLMIMGFNFLGDSLRDSLDPRYRDNF